MKAVVNVEKLATALKRLKPHSSRRSLREPKVFCTAAGTTMAFIGTMDNHASCECRVIDSGQCTMPLESMLRLLRTYPKKSEVTLRFTDGRLYVENVSFPSQVSL